MISFEEYKKIYQKMHPMSVGFDVTEDEMEVQYYEDFFGKESEYTEYELSNEKEKLINLLCKINEKVLSESGLSTLYGSFYFIVDLLMKIEDSSEIVNRLELEFLSKIVKRLLNKLDDGFELFWKENIENLKLRTARIGHTGFGVAKFELKFQRDIFFLKHKEIMQMGEVAPWSIIDWFNYYKILHTAALKDFSYNYDRFYFTLLQLSILRSKDLNRFDLLSQFVIEREELITQMTSHKYKKMFRKYFLGKVLGYGEKLENIILSLILFGTIMVLLYMNIDLCGMPDNRLDRFIAAIYFFFTTSFTIGYGDISPKTSIARIIVMINQIGGFFLSASLVALYIRKWFRD